MIVRCSQSLKDHETANWKNVTQKVTNCQKGSIFIRCKGNPINIVYPSNNYHEKMNSREQIRDLREKCDKNSPLLASCEDVPDLNDGSFIVATRSRRGRKVKISVPEDHRESDNDILVPSASTEPDQNDPQRLPDAEFPETNRSSEVLQLEIILQDNDKTLNNVRHEEVPGKQRAWCNTSRTETKRVVDSSTDCSICFQPWTSDKVVLEECGHCFHSECIRLWMKRKNTCPFCARFSLLPEEFPRLE